MPAATKKYYKFNIKIFAIVGFLRRQQMSFSIRLKKLAKLAQAI